MRLCPRFRDRCLALQGTKCPRNMDFRNIGSDAAWPMTAISHETYMALDHASLSPWRVMPGFNFLSITYDFMHNFFLGTARDLCASAIKVFIDHRLVGDPGSMDMDELLCLIHGRMRRVCREHGYLVLALAAHSFRIVFGGLCDSPWTSLHTVAKRDKQQNTFSNPKMALSRTHRLSLPCKPNLTLANIGGEDGYFTMGSRWKASHIKLIVWWVAKESELLARGSADPLFNQRPHCFHVHVSPSCKAQKANAFH